MVTERNIRTNVAFYPPERDGGAWHATMDSLERALREAFPDPTIGHRRSSVDEMT